jgi:Cu(I)/Ag(I) efflux system membrane fusion protein
VLDTGTRKIVYLARPNGVFEAREVAVGTPSEDLFPVTSGLAKGDKVVLSGNFLIDSQAHLSSGMSGMYGGAKEFAANQAGPAAASDKGAASAATIDFHADNTPLKVGEDNTFRAGVTGADGKAIVDAHVTVTLVMPAMPSMGMPEMKSSFELPWTAGQHAYVGKGQPGMSGSWSVTVEARRNGAAIATIHTHLSAK